MQHENAKSSQPLCCCRSLIVDDSILRGFARLKNFKTFFRRFCLREMFFIHRDMQNIFVFFSTQFGTAAWHAMQRKCNKCEELWLIINAFIHVHRDRKERKPVLMTSFLRSID